MHLKVGIDITPVLNKIPRGIGSYIYELTHHMKNVQYFYLFKLSRLKYPSRLKRLWDHPLPFFEISQRPFFFRKFQIFHGTDNYIPDTRTIPRILTVHDIYPLIASPEGGAAQKLKRAIRRSPDRIIFISKFARKEFLEYFPEFEGKSHVVYHGVSDFWKPVEKEIVKKHLKKLGIKRPYILYAGDTDERKNVERLLEAVSRIKDILLVMSGGKLKKHQVDIVKSLKLESKVLHVGYVSREVLRSLYNGALLFVFPSRYEGFGLPLLEAMKCETPVVASNIEIFKEIADGAMYPVDPLSSESIEEGIKKVISDQDLRATLIERGKVVSGRFTWSETAKKTYEVYNLALSNGKAE